MRLTKLSSNNDSVILKETKLRMASIEKVLANEISKASGVQISKLGLRFDKVVVRLLGNIRTAVQQEVPKEKAVIITITAPIKQPGKTEYELIGKIKVFLTPAIVGGYTLGGSTGAILIYIFAS